MIKREMSADSRAQGLFHQDRSASGEIHESKLLESNQQSLLSQQTCYFILNVINLNMENSSGEAVQVIQTFCLFGLQKNKTQTWYKLLACFPLL